LFFLAHAMADTTLRLWTCYFLCVRMGYELGDHEDEEEDMLCFAMYSCMTLVGG
jgi:hypothetical protein